jgi:SAM-dependent methyltransferase
MNTQTFPQGYALDPGWLEERRRLDSLTQHFDPNTLAIGRQIGVGPGWSCLDVGAGTGSLATKLAQVVGDSGRVVAVDRDPRFLEPLTASGIEVRSGDVTAEPLGESEYDLVHCRLLLEHLPERDDVLRSMIRAVRPGGWLLVEDFDMATKGVVDPPSEVHARVTDAVVGFLVGRGMDPDLGRRLQGMLRRDGLADVGGAGFVFQVTADVENGVPQWELLVDQLAPALLELSRVTQEDLVAFRELCHDGRTTMLAPLMMSAWGRRPEPSKSVAAGETVP